MARYVWKRIREFTAYSDDGRDITLTVRGKIRVGSSVLVDPKEESTFQGKRLFMGKHVLKRVEQGVYKVLDTGMILKSDDPSAP